MTPANFAPLVALAERYLSIPPIHVARNTRGNVIASAIGNAQGSVWASIDMIEVSDAERVRIDFGAVRLYANVIPRPTRDGATMRATVSVEVCIEDDRERLGTSTVMPEHGITAENIHAAAVTLLRRVAARAQADAARAHAKATALAALVP